MHPIPQPYPDEVVGSVLIRTCQRYGISVARLSEGLFKSPRKFAPMLMSSNINKIAEVSSIDQNAYLWKHTIFPYAIAFMPVSEVLRMQHKAILSNEPIQHSTLTYTVSMGVPFLRYCRTCIQEDMLIYGESYWHRAHMLPAVYFCNKHNTSLYETKLVSHRMQTSTMALPQNVKGVLCDISNTDVLTSLTKLSVELLNQNDLKDNNGLINKYRQLALEIGYVKTEYLIASQPLARDLHAFYGAALLKSLGCDFEWDSRSAWPMLMLREKIGIRFTTVKHVLLQVFLNYSTAKKGTFKYRLAGREMLDYSDLDLKCANLAKKEILKNQSISLRYVADMLGCWSAVRHNRQKFPLTLAVLQEQCKSH